MLKNSGPNFLNVLYNGVVVAESSNRIIDLTSVPEPSSFVFLGTGALAVVGLGRYRRRRVVRD